MGEAKRRTISGDMVKPIVSPVVKEQPMSLQKVLTAGHGSSMATLMSLINEYPKLPK